MLIVFVLIFDAFAIKQSAFTISLQVSNLEFSLVNQNWKCLQKYVLS